MDRTLSRIIVNSCKNMTKSRSGLLKISLSLPHSLYVCVRVCKNINSLIISTYIHKYTHNIYDIVYIGTYNSYLYIKQYKQMT